MPTIGLCQIQFPTPGQYTFTRMQLRAEDSYRYMAEVKILTDTSLNIHIDTDTNTGTDTNTCPWLSLQSWALGDTIYSGQLKKNDSICYDTR